MAILNGILKKLNGSAGQLTFKTVNGRTIVSEKVTTVRNVRSPRQLRQRMKWGNLVRMYAGIAPLLKYGFEKKGTSVSDYNMFMRVNNALSPVYLTKYEADGGGCIAAPYQLTQGSLPSIVVSGTGLIQQRKLGTDEVLEFRVSGEHIQAVHMLPGYTHNIINLSDTEDLVTLMWANECFDPQKPDTFYEAVEL